MAISQMVGARVSDETVQQIEALAIRRGMLLPDGKANLSAALRLALEIGLTSLRLEQRRTDPRLPQRTVDKRLPGTSLQSRIRTEEIK